MRAPDPTSIQPGTRTRPASHVLALSALLLLASILTVGCGSKEPEATTAQVEPAATPTAETPEPAPPELASPELAQEAPEEATPAPEPRDAAQPAEGQAPPPPPSEEPSTRERELADREARVAEREAALEKRIARLEEALPKQEPTAPTASQPTRPPAQPSEPAVGPEAAPSPEPDELPAAEDEALRSEDETWRLSQHRTDRAAREGLEPEPEEVGDVSLEPSLEPVPEVEPEIWDSRLLPSGTRLTVELAEEVASNTAQAGDLFHSVVAEDVLRGGDVVIPAGSTVVGRVVEAVPLNERVGGRARLDLEFHLLEIPGAPDPDGVPIQADFAVKGKNESARDAATIGGAAVGGAILGRVLDKGDKGKGTVLGALIGAAAGTVIASRSEGEEVVLPEGARIELVLTHPVEVPVRR